MRGFPKHFNSKQDFMNCLELFPEETKAELQRLLDDRFVWVDTAILNGTAGVVDSTHRVIESDDGLIQQELKEDTNAKLFRLGFTVSEVEEILND